MLALFGAPENFFFVCALVLMVLIGVAQAVGLAGEFGGHPDVDLDSDLDLLSWLGVGRLPLLMLMVVFLGLFALVGLLGQQLSHDMLGSYLGAWLAVPAALLVALPLTGLAARVLARVLPRDETSAIELEALTGRAARIVTGQAAHGSPARARVEDRHGQAHYVMVEPSSPTEQFAEGEIVLLVRQEADRFLAISRGDHLLPRLER